jgi:pyruvate dehydrogenase E2 component (dihydrolipoamide acetyltransferase)
MTTELHMPKLGLSMVEGSVIRWLVSEGSPVKLGQTVLEIETDKTIAEVEAVADGFLHIVIPEGDVVAVGTTVAYIAATADELNSLEDQKVIAAEVAPISRADPRLNPESVMADVVTDNAVNAGASPLAKKLAKELGVDLSKVAGTGPDGQIRKEDVLSTAERTKKGREVTGGSGEEVVPLTGIRKVIAERMHSSLMNAAQLTTMREIDVTELSAYRKKLEQGDFGPPQKVSFTALMVRAVGITLKRYPELNAHITEAGICSFSRIRLGVAMNSERGLIVPVIPDPDLKSLAEIQGEVMALRKRADSGSLALDEMSGSTFTITTTGADGADFGTPILNPPEVAILLTGRIRDLWRWKSGEPELYRVMGMSLTYDHRAVDGVPTTRFLVTLEEICQNPNQLL